MKTLKPQALTEKDYSDVRKRVEKLIFELVFAPLAAVTRGVNKKLETSFHELRNAPEDERVLPLLLALRSGTVQYKNGVFSGSFSRAISSSLRGIGAHFDHRTGEYRVDDLKVPVAVRAAAAAYEAMARGAHDLILKKLDEAYTQIDAFMKDYDLGAEGAVDAVVEGFTESAAQLEVMPQLTPESLEVLEEEYTENLKLFIKGFAEHEIVRLRKDVEANARAGYRFDRLAHIIQAHSKVSTAKAEFLARQETSLFMSEFRKLHFKEAGVQRYIWRTSKDTRVRDSHAHLEGKIFSYDDPPIVDPASGRRRNPGEDYGCRCVDEPVLEPVQIGD